MDLYRLDGSPRSLEGLGVKESLEKSVMIVEWANRMRAADRDRLIPSRLEVRLKRCPQGDGRLATVMPVGARWDSMVCGPFDLESHALRLVAGVLGAKNYDDE